jgi:fucose permease
MAALTQDRDESEYRLLHAGAFVALFVVGVYAAAFGPALEFIANDLDVSLDTAGFILTVFFVGSISASALVAVALHARDTRALTVAGLAFVIVGALTLGFAPAWPLALGGGIVMGLGDGLIVAALHILMTITSRDVPRAINALNLYFAFGAVAGPLWSGTVLALTERRSIAYAGIAAVAGVALAMLLAARPPIRERRAEDAEFRLPGNPTAWIMGAVLFLYVGAEFGLGSWVSAYARESAGSGVFEAALLTAGYWAALMCGRIASSIYYARQRDALPLLAVSIAGAGAASLVLAVTTGNIAASAIAAFGAGLFLGPVWPSTVAIASARSEAHATAMTVTMGNAGGIVLPWLQGRILVDGGPAQGVAVSVVLCAAMLAIVGGFRLRRVTG